MRSNHQRSENTNTLPSSHTHEESKRKGLNMGCSTKSKGSKGPKGSKAKQSSPKLKSKQSSPKSKQQKQKKKSKGKDETTHDPESYQYDTTQNHKTKISKHDKLKINNLTNVIKHKNPDMTYNEAHTKALQQLGFQ